MRFLSKAPDGGQGSGVTGYFLVEIKSLFSIALLRFDKGSREAFHEHAFNAWTVWLWGEVIEMALEETGTGRLHWSLKRFIAGDIKRTPRHLCHRITARRTTWALSFRGPWVDRWREFRPGRGWVTLTHGRKEVP